MLKSVKGVKGFLLCKNKLSEKIMRFDEKGQLRCHCRNNFIISYSNKIISKKHNYN